MDIYKHESFCEKAALAWKGHQSIKDGILVQQSLDGPYSV